MSACGSTVDLTSVAGGGTSLAGDSSGLGLNDGITGGDPVTSGGATPGATTPGATTAGGGGAVAPDATATPGSDSTTGPVSSLPTAVATATGPIEIGIPHADAAKANGTTASIGKGLGENDVKQLYAAYVADFNKRGGIGGRPIKIIDFTYDGSTLDVVGQQICDYFTQDHKVSIVLTPDMGNKVYPCLTKKGVAVLTTSMSETSTSLLNTLPTAILPGTVALDRLQTAFVPQLESMGYISPSKKATEKIGVAYFENKATVDGFNALKSALSAKGYSIAATSAIQMASGTGDLAAMEVAVKGAQLKFKAAGVNRVMCVELNAFICGFFAIYAAQQGYYPRYAFTSAQPLTNITANVGPKGLDGSVFIGWHASQDVQKEADMPASLRSCVNFFRRAGFTIDTGNKYAQASVICGDIQYLGAALAKAPSTTAAGLLAGAKALGSTFSAPDGFSSLIGDRRDGVSSVRQGKYFVDCKCYRYTGGNIRI